MKKTYIKPDTMVDIVTCQTLLNATSVSAEGISWGDNGSNMEEEEYDNLSVDAKQQFMWYEDL